MFTFSHLLAPRPGGWRFLIGSLAVVVLLVLPSIAYADVLYVDGSLSGQCSGVSYDVAFRNCRGSDARGFSNFAAGVAAMRPGDTLAVRAGMYRTPLVVMKSGALGAPLRIAAHAGEQVIIDLSGAPGYSSGIDIGSQRFIELSGLTVLNAPVYGFRATGATDIVVMSSEFGFSTHAGMVFEGGARITVAGVRIHHNNTAGLGSWHEAITFAGVAQFAITDSEIFENSKEGIDAKYGSSAGVIARNLVYRNNGPNIYIDAATDIQIYGNICRDTLSNSKGCIGISIESSFNPERFQTRDVAVFNNVIYGSAAGIQFWIENGGLSWARFEGIRIEYNTIVDNAQRNWGGIYFINGAPRNFGAGNTIRNNILMGNGGAGIRDDFGISQLFAVDNNLFQSRENSNTLGVNAVVTAANPFVNRAGRDFHLVSGSPARNIGQPLLGIATDLAGQPRPAIGATDVGAYQYVPPPPPLTDAGARE